MKSQVCNFKIYMLEKKKKKNYAQNVLKKNLKGEANGRR